LQAGLWLSFVFGYQLIQAGAGRDRSQALTNGVRIMELERDLAHRLVELPIQGLTRDSRVLDLFTTLVYRGSEFVVVGLALLWVYLHDHGAFPRLRNTLIVTNMLALVAFYVFPTAPPRAFGGLGFVDTVRGASGAGVGHGFELLPSNQYAAIPSLHSADALIIGISLALLVRSRFAKLVWLLWAPVVWLSVIATANHFWLDVAAGIALAGIGAFVVEAAEALKRASRARSPSGVGPAEVLEAGRSTLRP